MPKLTESDLLAMRELQTATPEHTCSHNIMCEACFFDRCARTDWPRVTEWALEARRLLEAYRAGTISDGPMLAEVKRLLGEG